jgi:hypothetical protein
MWSVRALFRSPPVRAFSGPLPAPHPPWLASQL